MTRVALWAGRPGPGRASAGALVDADGASAETVRRAVLAVYLEPGHRPDLRIPLHRRTLHLARRWTFNTLPLTGRHQASLVRRRVDTMAGLYLSVLLEDWARVCAIETSLVPPRQMLEGRIADPGSAGSASPTH